MQLLKYSLNTPKWQGLAPLFKELRIKINKEIRYTDMKPFAAQSAYTSLQVKDQVRVSIYGSHQIHVSI